MRSLLQFRVLTLIVLGVLFVPLYAQGQDETAVTYSTTTEVISNSEILSGESARVQARVQIENNIPPQMFTGGLPDFTDDGLSWLVSRAGRAAPVYVSTCVKNYFNQFYATLTGAPTSGTFRACSPTGDIAQACDLGTVMEWSMTANQKVAWNATPTAVRLQFAAALVSYKTALSVSGAAWFPFIVKGLDYSGTETAPYTSVDIVAVTTTAAGTYEWIVTLTR
ncbi:MAG: hypothetical protein HQ472_04165 [Ignavibacteria bacterium]|nr:hypothetical protein [Ignavibacteria bacterium]